MKIILPSTVLLALCVMFLDCVHGQVPSPPPCHVCGDDDRSQHYAHTGMCYHAFEGPLDWDDAKADCEARGGTLAMPKSKSINTILIEIINEYSEEDFWIGLSSDDAGDWWWCDGTQLIVPPDYHNFPVDPPPADTNSCACIAKDTVNGITETGQWLSVWCGNEQPYICEIPYTSPCEENKGFYCPETGLCYCLRYDNLLSWYDARFSCWGGNGDLAVANSEPINRGLRNLVWDFETIPWAAWIAGQYNDMDNQWYWVGWSTPIGPYWNFFVPGPPAGGCITIGNIAIPAGSWDNEDCFNLHWYFCMAYFPISACCDPHFVVHAKGMKEPVCFDYYGEDNDVIQLISSTKYDLAVNGEVFSHEHTKKTWFGALSLVAPGCTMVADTKGIHLNDKPIDWIDVEDQPCGRSGVTYSIKDDFYRKSTHLIIHVMSGLEFIFTKDEKTYKFGTVEYMDFDMTQHYGLDETTDGILGEFMGMTINLDEDSVKNDTDTGILYFPDEPGRGSVTAHRVSRKNLLTNKHFHCWNVEDEGAGLVRGKARDYLVPDLFTGQKARNLRQIKEEEAADAIF